jgi:hypothetical protein
MNPEEAIRELENLAAAMFKEKAARIAIFILSYETLEDVLRDRVKSFFSCIPDNPGKTIGLGAGGKVKPTTRYRKEIRAAWEKYARPRGITGEFDEVVASCFWFEEMSAIGEGDTRFVLDLRKKRGEFTHEMGKVLSREDVSEQELRRILQLVSRIDEWWLHNFEDVPEDSRAISGNVLLLSAMIECVFGNSPGRKTVQ